MEDKNLENVATESVEDVKPAVPEGSETVVDFNIKWHRIGRIFDSIGLTLIVLVPIVAGIYYKAMPDWSVLLNSGVITYMLINLGSCLAEPVIYAPILGTNGEYLAFISGNLSNLKIPCVAKAHDIYPTKQGTEEHELVSTIAVAVSSLVTALIIAVVVLALVISDKVAETAGGSSLQDIIEQNKFLTPAFGCVVYALFGSLGGKYIAQNPKMAFIAGGILIVASIVLAIVGMSIGSTASVVGIVLCALVAIVSFLRERKKAKQKEEQRRLQAIACGMSYEKICEIQYYQRKEEEEKALQAKADKKAQRKAIFKK